jgi:hypothetical protein
MSNQACSLYSMYEYLSMQTVDFTSSRRRMILIRRQQAADRAEFLIIPSQAAPAGRRTGSTRADDGSADVNPQMSDDGPHPRG